MRTSNFELKDFTENVILNAVQFTKLKLDMKCTNDNVKSEIPRNGNVTNTTNHFTRFHKDKCSRREVGLIVDLAHLNKSLNGLLKVSLLTRN